MTYSHHSTPPSFKFIGISLAALLALAAPSLAQANTVSGKVYNDSDLSQSLNGDAGIAGVTVALFNVAGNSCGSTTTDGSGNYSFSGVASGQHRIYEVAGETAGSLSACPPSENVADPATRTVTPGTIQDPAGYMSTTPNRIDINVTGNKTGQNFGDTLRGDPIECGSIAYLFQDQPTDAYRLDLVTGGYEELASDWTDQTNAIGYDVHSELIWGCNREYDNRVTIANGNWNQISLEVVNLNGDDNDGELFDANAGDVDLDGYLYAGVAGNGYTWRKIDINPQRTTYLHAVNWTTGESDPQAIRVRNPKTGLDMAFSPRDGQIYS
ncbi:MAG: hypothetical protein MK097_17870, partial [Dechloromonas sp.]|nr:hypothetical protein [Dechloromonas sp.]